MTTLGNVVAHVAQRLIEAAPLLNDLDSRAGDGDLGVTMSHGARALLAMDTVDGEAAADLLRRCGRTLASKAPSTAGTLLATGVLAASQVPADPDSPGQTLARCLRAALTAIADRGGAQTGARTMLDALAPAAEAAERAASTGADLPEVLGAAAEAADAGAVATANMVPRYGRAGWMPERAKGHEDSGARLVALILQAAHSALPARS